MCMKAIKAVIGIMILLSPVYIGVGSTLAADQTAATAAAKVFNQDTGVKGKIKADKQKIAEERNGILAASRRLGEAKKTRDKVTIEQVKKEVDAEIKERKSRINTLKNDIERLNGGAGSFAPSSKDRAKENK